MIEVLKQPWPWWVSGPLIGLMVPVLLLLGNKVFGLSSSLRHICAACFPANISFFKYDWKKESWNLFFAAGILVGSFLAWNWLSDYRQLNINPKLLNDLNNYGVSDHSNLIPTEIINWNSLLTFKGIIMVVMGGFLIGFGTRYGEGCTSGHAISGLSNLQWPSLVATMCFMGAGFLTANFILPIILKL
ncbi:MAG: YeeE/YedE thiosulfate transporter family protein [Chitinophagaceae bacterium]|nr:YeeE/YedE thiosulfate transporter family protein [Chitinophagaceae bacterium]